MNQQLRITLLGGLCVQQGERTVTRFKSQKIGALLAYLAYHLQQAHPREVLIDLFWPESSLEAGRNSLSVALSSLRNQLEPPGTPANAVLRADRFSVGLNPAAVTTDVLEFARALQQSAQADSAAERTQLLAQAADLYQERLLPGYYEDWIGIEQERLSGLFFEGVTRLITHLEARGDLSAALHYARRAVRADALREEAHEALMRLLAASGQPGAALRQYREMERLLHAGLGVEPSAPLRALARQIEQQTGLASPPIMAPVSVSRPLGPADAPAAAANAPVTRTFLMTEIAGAVRIRESGPEEVARTLLERVQALLRQTFARHGGQVPVRNGLLLEQATGIDDEGRIRVKGQVNGKERKFLLTPR